MPAADVTRWGPAWGTTPLVLLKADGQGFQVFSLWYTASTDGCTRGTTHFAIHEVSALGAGSVTLKYAKLLDDEQVSSVVFVGGRMMYMDTTGAVVDITSAISPKFIQGGQAGWGSSGYGRYRRINWSEMP